MSKLETPLTRKYWNEVGGTLIEEFNLVLKNKNHARRLADGLIILGGPKIISKERNINIKNKNVIVLQTKAKKIGMNVCGQALVSKMIIEKYHEPKSVKSVIICTKGDDIVEEQIRQFKFIEIKIYE